MNVYKRLELGFIYLYYLNLNKPFSYQTNMRLQILPGADTPTVNGVWHVLMLLTASLNVTPLRHSHLANVLFPRGRFNWIFFLCPLPCNWVNTQLSRMRHMFVHVGSQLLRQSCCRCSLLKPMLLYGKPIEMIAVICSQLDLIRPVYTQDCVNVCSSPWLHCGGWTNYTVVILISAVESGDLVAVCRS